MGCRLPLQGVNFRLAKLCFAVLIATQVYAAYSYTLDINIPDVDAIMAKQQKISGVEFKVSGDSNFSWTFGDAVPTEGNWILEGYGGDWWYLYDNYPLPLRDDTIFPISKSGTLLVLRAELFWK